MSALTETELRAIEARAEAATPGEWRVRKGEGLWWTVEVELPSINGLRCWYTIARFDFDMAANGYTDGALRPEADATLLANARQDIPRLAAALREAWAKHGEYWHRADRAEKPLLDQVKAVGREVGLRRNVYPQRVARMSMDQATADREIAAMEAAYRTLQWVLRHRDRLLELAPELREGAPS